MLLEAAAEKAAGTPTPERTNSPPRRPGVKDEMAARPSIAGLLFHSRCRVSAAENGASVRQTLSVNHYGLPISDPCRK